MPAPMVLGLEKVVKNRPKHFSAILITNDKNCTPNRVGIFWCKTKSSGLGFQLCLLQHASMVPEPEKVVKIQQKHFEVILAGNNKNGTTNSVSMFRVKNRVIRDRF